MEYYNIVNNTYFRAIKDSEVISKFKVEMLDGLENVVSEITKKISRDNAGTLNYTYQQGVRATSSFSIFDPNGEFLPGPNTKDFWIRKKFKFSIGIEKTRFFFKDNINIFSYDINELISILNARSINVTSESVDSQIDTFWFSRGTFVIKDISISTGASGRIITISGVDKFGLLGGDTGYNELLGTYKIPAGTKMFNAIRDLLNEDVGNGYPLDPIEPYLDPSIVDMECPYDLTKGPGSYMSDLIISIANIFGCDVYYDMNGRLTFSLGTIDSSYGSKSSAWNFNPLEDGFDEPVLTLDLSSVINSVMVVGDNINNAVFSSLAENNNPSSSTRIDLIGRKTKYITSSFAYDQSRADEYARYKLNQLSIVQKSISFKSIIIPHLDVNNIFTLTSDYYHYDRERFILQSLSYTLGSSSMSISGSNLADLPYYEQGA